MKILCQFAQQTDIDQKSENFLRAEKKNINFFFVLIFFFINF